MNVFCPNCGSPNEGSNKFCWKCGHSLAAVPRDTAPDQSNAELAAAPPTAEPAAAPSKPRGPAPAAVPPEVYQAPAPVPAPAAPPAQPAPLPSVAPAATTPQAMQPRLPTRLTTPMLLGSLAAVLGIGAAVGIALGSSKPDTGPGTGSITSPAPSLDLRTPGPVVSLQPVPTDQPIETVAAATQGPVLTQAPVPTAAPGDTVIVRTDGVSIMVPASWEQQVKDDGITLYPPEGGFLYLFAAPQTASLTATQVLADDLAWFKEHYPDVKICSAEKDETLPKGPAGRIFILCYTDKTKSGKTFAALDLINAATATVDGQPYLFYLDVYMPRDKVNAILAAMGPVLPTIRWAKYSGS